MSSPSAKRVVLGVAGVGLVAFLAYFAYATYESSLQLVEAFEPADCRTPQVAHGWAYEPINYDRADDEDLARRFRA